MQALTCTATMSVSRVGSRGVSTITGGDAIMAKTVFSHACPTATTDKVRCPSTTAIAFSADASFSPRRCRGTDAVTRRSGRLRSEVAVITVSRGAGPSCGGVMCLASPWERSVGVSLAVRDTLTILVS